MLAGRIEYIQNKQLGSLTFSIDGEVKKCADFINYLVDNVEDVEVRVYGK
ncbi:MAG: NIL domain-containing protein [Gemella morbillorum]|nr:NIL domain-containing protein [Gemella morbillorum]MDK8239739.1 NIL domain-containing protein [Gemella morbillorum]